MESRHLIDAIVQQTTLLIAQLSTAAGIRAPLARLADQVFLELSRELEAQGVTRKVAADMFGLALRSYQKKIQRLSIKACDADAECGSELACLCGACTKTCRSDASCGDAAPGAKCIAAGDPAVEAICGTRLKEPAVCVAACKRDGDCESQADGLRCQAGLCVPVAAPTCDPEEKCAGFHCIADHVAHAKCDAQGNVQCSCVAVEPQTCIPNGTYDEEGQFNFDAMLAKVPLAGGTYVRLREDLNEIGRAVFVGDAAYWFNVKDGISFQVTGKRFDSDAPTNIFLVDHAQSPLVADEDAFYWLEHKDPNGPVELMRASRAIVQPEPTRLLALPEPATGLTLNGNRVYWGSADSGLWSANKDGSAVAHVVEANAELRGPAVFAVDPAAVYWSWASEPENVGLGLFGPDPDVKLSLTEGMSARLGGALALDDTHVYWVHAVSGDPQYSLVRTSKVPFATETVWRSAELTAATKVLVHGDFLYVSTLRARGEGKILRIQRPRM